MCLIRNGTHVTDCFFVFVFQKVVITEFDRENFKIKSIGWVMTKVELFHVFTYSHIFGAVFTIVGEAVADCLNGISNHVIELLIFRYLCNFGFPYILFCKLVLFSIMIWQYHIEVYHCFTDYRPLSFVWVELKHWTMKENCLIKWNLGVLDIHLINNSL